MDPCSSKDIIEENKLCEEADIFMNSDAWSCSTHYYEKEEKECVDENGNIQKYIICRKISFDSSQQA